MDKSKSIWVLVTEAFIDYSQCTNSRDTCFSIECRSESNDYYYDVQLPINHVISKTVLHLVAVCITSLKHSKHMLKVCRKFS